MKSCPICKKEIKLNKKYCNRECYMFDLKKNHPQLFLPIRPIILRVLNVLNPFFCGYCLFWIYATTCEDAGTGPDHTRITGVKPST